MSNFEFKLPDIGEGVTEGEIVNWLVQAGDSVSENQEMVEVMTDKATVTIGAPKTGKVSELRFKVGDTVPVGEVLIVLDVGGEGAPKAEAPKADAPKAKPESARAAPSAPAASAVGDIREHLPGMPAPEPSQPPRNGNSEYFTDKPLAAPATRKLARELGVDLRRVEPSGSAGRVTREDVEQFASGSRTAAPVAARHEVRPPAPPPPRNAPPAQRQEDERIPIRGLRKRIYENMARSKHTAAHFHYVDEVDVTELRALRERTAPIVERTGAKLNFLPIIIKAVVAALRKHPRLNSVVDDSALELVVRKNYDIGIAVATENGLIVPVLRNADRLSIVDMAHEIERLANAAREGKSQQADLGGSTFTVTSLGKLGGLIAPPIINYPEVGIMGIHAMKKRPVVRGDQIVIGEVMHLSFSFDHRVIDGDVGANFAQEIIGFLQEPDRLFVEMA